MKTNNLIYIYGLVLLMAVASLFLPWGSFLSPPNLFLITTTGLNGHISFFNINIPNMILTGLVIVAAATQILNILKIVSIPRVIPIILDTFALVWLLIGLLVYFFLGNLMVGIILINIAALSFLILALFIKKKN